MQIHRVGHLTTPSPRHNHSHNRVRLRIVAGPIDGPQIGLPLLPLSLPVPLPSAALAIL